MVISGYPARSWHHPSVPGRPGSARPDIPTPAVFRDPAGPGPAQQVWVSGAVQTRPSAGPQTASGEMAEGGQGMWRRSQGTWLSPHTPTRASSSVRLCVCVYATGSGNRVCSSHVFFLTPQTERMPSYFCDKEGACVKTDFVDCENDRVCVNACVCYLRCLLWMWCHVFVMWGEGVFGFFPSKAQKKVLGFISVCFVKSALNIAEIKCSFS